MRRSVLALAGLAMLGGVLASGRAEAAFLSGAGLLDACRSGAEANHSLCSAYVVGVADSLVVLQGFTTLKRKACFAPSVDSNALINAVVAHAEQRPQDAGGSGAELVYTALATFYPCNG